VLIDAQYRKCVVFLFADVPNQDTGEIERTPAASAMLVSVPLQDAGLWARYVVTARHVLTLSRKYGSLFARIHLLDGSSMFWELPPRIWHQHPTTDVAVASLRVPGEIDHTFISTEQFELDSLVRDHLVGIGDDVFFVGLFSEHPGSERNQPVLRFGNIALMPDEKLHIELGDSAARIRAYLVEARSWGGHSGSPAFVYFPPDRFGDRIQLQTQVPIFLLGIVQGHYEIKSDVAFLGDILGSGKVPVNAGMAVVVPAQEINDILMDEELVAARDRALRGQIGE